MGLLEARRAGGGEAGEGEEGEPESSAAADPNGEALAAVRRAALRCTCARMCLSVGVCARPARADGTCDGAVSSPRPAAPPPGVSSSLPASKRLRDDVAKLLQVRGAGRGGEEETDRNREGQRGGLAAATLRPALAAGASFRAKGRPTNAPRAPPLRRCAAQALCSFVERSHGQRITGLVAELVVAAGPGGPPGLPGALVLTAVHGCQLDGRGSRGRLGTFTERWADYLEGLAPAPAPQSPGRRHQVGRRHHQLGILGS
jgi:hypothetical protein